MSKNTKLSVAGIVVLALVIGVIVLTAMRSGTKAVSVRIEPVQKRDLIASVTASGNVTPHTKVDLSSDITGKIVRLAVKEGQMVSKGQFLLQIDPQEAQANVQRARGGALRGEGLVRAGEGEPAAGAEELRALARDQEGQCAAHLR